MLFGLRNTKPLAPMSKIHTISNWRTRRMAKNVRLLSTGVVIAMAGMTVAGEFASAESGIVGSHRYADEMRRPPSSLWSLLHPSADAENQPTEVTVVTPAAGRKTRALAVTVEEPAVDPLASGADDPLEPLNRLFFGINEVIDLVVLRPVSFIYRTVVPSPLRQGIANAVTNAASPVIFANDLLQGDIDAAKTTLVRFMVNSTAGFGGLVDAAGAAGVQGRNEDFGQTLGVWGVGAGPYLVVPVLGPTTVRDGTGRVVDLAFSPLTWILWDMSIIERASPTMATVVTTHESIMDGIQATRESSPDFYASVRDIYLQKREADIANGAAADAVLEPINPDY